MAANTGATLDTLAGVIQSIAHDKKLLQWFGALAGKPAVERRNEIFSATRQMTEKREDEKVINSLLLLADAKIFDAARQALIELGHIRKSN